jgi:hypothetical protein
MVMVTETALEILAAQGLDPPEPQILSSFSGQMRVRMPRTLHQKLAGRARMEDVSLNTLIVSILAEGIGAMETLPSGERKTRRPKRIAGEVAAQREDAEERSPGHRKALGGAMVRPQSRK